MVRMAKTEPTELMTYLLVGLLMVEMEAQLLVGMEVEVVTAGMQMEEMEAQRMGVEVVTAGMEAQLLLETGGVHLVVMVEMEVAEEMLMEGMVDFYFLNG
jgi:hypothetical protein